MSTEPWTLDVLEWHFDDWVFGHTMNKAQGKMCRDVVAGYLRSIGLSNTDDPAAEIASLKQSAEATAAAIKLAATWEKECFRLLEELAAVRGEVKE